MPITFLLALAWLWIAPVPAPAQQEPDPIASLVAALEAAASAGDRDAFRALGTDPDALYEMAISLTMPAPTRLVIKERDRTSLESGGHRVLLEVLWERGREGRLSTWTVDAVQAGDAWRLTAPARLAHVSGLYRLDLDPEKQFRVTQLTFRAPDLSLHMKSGSAFVAETPDGVTAVVLLGRGEVRFTPPDAAERIQLRIFSGSEALVGEFDGAFIRVRPEDFAYAFPQGSLVPREVDSGDLRRAADIFDEYVGRSLQINMLDLSSERWSIVPQGNDIIAEIRTRRHGTLTYTRSGQDPEDITLFDRRRRRNIAVYASKEKLATRGRFYSEDDRVDYDILAYDIDVAFTPERDRVEGTTRMKLRIRSNSASTVNLRLAESLRVRGVFAPGYGRLLHLRIVNQNSLVVSLPATMLQGTELWLSITYAGELPAQELEREAITVSQQDPLELATVPPEPRYIYSNRTYWYPQSIVSDYATASLRVTVPQQYDVVASGTQVGPPAPPPGVAEGPARRMFVFEATQPVRYLACVISRFRDVGTVSAKSEDDGESPSLNILANSRQVGRARGFALRAAEIYAFYASTLGDVPYADFTVAFTERDLPGGHSPAYFAIVDQPQRGPTSWRNDPVNFDNYPTFFLAHEIAHQWWGQAIGWKNYHEQWLSEGLAQYFAALYAEQHLDEGVIENLLKQMRQTAIRQSSEGPVYLGYRLGHIKRDARVFRSIIYNKSAMVLHMLRRLIGDEAFFDGLRRFYNSFKYEKAGTDDLIGAMESASGRELDAFFEAWIFGSSIPEVRVSHKVEGDHLLLRVEQLGAPVEFPLDIRLELASGRTDTVRMIVTEKVTEQVVPLSGKLRSVRPNADHSSLVEVR